MKIFIDWSISIGIKYQKEITKTSIKNIEIKLAEKVFDLVYLLRNLIEGVKTYARMKPDIMESKTGFSMKKDKTMRTARIIVDVIFLK